MTATATPRATLLMLTYNQQEVVADSVRAALAQDYPNLQIIVSDDCSSDATFATAAQIGGDYLGKHQLVVRQPPHNLGLIPHLYDAARLAEGELIIVAAGDDISYPHRVSRLIGAWQDSGASALCSGWDVCDAVGAIIERDCVGGRSDLRFNAYFPTRSFTQIIGATAAYIPDVFRLIPQPPPEVYAEDLYFSLVLAWRGQTVFEVPEPLLAYRQHASAMTHIGTEWQTVVDQEHHFARSSARVAALLEAFDRATAQSFTSGLAGQHILNREALLEDIAFNRYRAGWIGCGPIARLRALARFRSPAHRRWLLPRQLGIAALRRGKSLLR
ncbi:glycosyltransferase [Sphingomonas sp. RB1R13]|uniref:glycosyltransferase n=1 Tax=Sphingomonas sp. RB1R13 TaxID=3096159 RepID=UPI002FCC5065